MERRVADDEARVVLGSVAENCSTSDSSASAGMNAGFASQTFSNSSSSSATLVIELLLTSTRRPCSSEAGRFENSTTLRTGPSQEIARSGSRR